jgi:hypothetical protein
MSGTPLEGGFARFLVACQRERGRRHSCSEASCGTAQRRSIYKQMMKSRSSSTR